MISFSSFFDLVIAQTFPDDPAEELLTSYRRYVENALIQLQTHVRCLQDNHVEWWKKGQLSDYCSLSMVELDAHVMIQSVYAFLPGQSCDRFLFKPRTVQFMQSIANAPSCSEMSLPYDPYEQALYDGTDYCTPCADGEPARDRAWEAHDKFYAIGPGNKLYLSPKLPCDYVLAVHWNGVKRNWSDSDLIVADADVIDACSTYLQAEHAQKIDRDMALANQLWAGEGNENSWKKKVGQLIHRCRLESEPNNEANALSGPDDISAWFDPNSTLNPYMTAASVCP